MIELFYVEKSTLQPSIIDKKHFTETPESTFMPLRLPSLRLQLLAILQTLDRPSLPNDLPNTNLLLIQHTSSQCQAKVMYIKLHCAQNPEKPPALK